MQNTKRASAPSGFFPEEARRSDTITSKSFGRVITKVGLLLRAHRLHDHPFCYNYLHQDHQDPPGTTIQPPTPKPTQPTVISIRRHSRRGGIPPGGGAAPSRAARNERRWPPGTKQYPAYIGKVRKTGVRQLLRPGHRPDLHGHRAYTLPQTLIN